MNEKNETKIRLGWQAFTVILVAMLSALTIGFFAIKTVKERERRIIYETELCLAAKG